MDFVSNLQTKNMMKNLASWLLILCLSSLSAQTKKVQEMLSEIQGEWVLDDSGNVTYQKILELPEMNKDAIYDRALHFFSYNMENEPLSLSENKDSGTILAKGIFHEVHSTGVFLDYTNIHCLNIVKIDTKEGKARILLTLTAYEIEAGNVGEDDLPSITSNLVNREFPLNKKGKSKTMMGKAFYKSHLNAMRLLGEISKAIKEGNTSPEFENSDW